MDYALRRDAAAPKDVFQQQTPQESGTYSGLPCLAPTVCAKGFIRIWVLSTTQPLSLYAGMSVPESTLLKTSYKPTSTEQFPGGITLVLLQALPAKA
jgi:mannosyltransferase